MCHEILQSHFNCNFNYWWFRYALRKPRSGLPNHHPVIILHFPKFSTLLISDLKSLITNYHLPSPQYGGEPIPPVAVPIGTANPIPTKKLSSVGLTIPVTIPTT